VVVTGWSIAVVVTTAVAGHPGIAGGGARISTQPLWFLAAYLPFVAGGRRLAAAAGRHVVITVGGSLVVLGVLDGARFVLGAPDWVGWPGFFAAWGVPWLLGGWWRSAHERGGLSEVKFGAQLAIGAGVVGGVLVTTAGYHVALIDAVPGTRSNTTPPTLYTAVAATAQVGVLILGATMLDRMGRRWRSLWDRAGELAVGVYVWHLTALALCVGVVAAGLPAPERLTTAWWATRPLWWAAVLTVTVVFVLGTARARAWLGLRRRGRARPPGGPTELRTVVAVIFVSAGAALVGLEGPRTTALALTCAGLFVSGWALLRSRATPASRSHS
jgi:hypothetical protein